MHRPDESKPIAMQKGITASGHTQFEHRSAEHETPIRPIDEVYREANLRTRLRKLPQPNLIRKK